MDHIETEIQRSRRPWTIAGLVVLGVVTVAAVVLLADPLGWHLLDKASGLQDEAAGAMPADTALYAEIDLINFSEVTITEFSQPFVAALAEPGVEDLGSGLERLDAMLAERYGLTLRDDVMPWLGRSVGLGLTELALMPDGQIDKVGWLLVAGTQDRDAADAFLEKLGQRASEMSGNQPEETEYNGRTITNIEFEPGDPFGGLAFTRSAGQVILGSDVGAVQAAVEAQQGESLADVAQFRMLTESLPEERGLTLYVDQGRLPELSRLLASAAPLAIGPLDVSNMILPPGAVGVRIVDQGLRLDLASPASGDEGGASPRPRQMASQFPAGTLVFVSGDSLDGAWGSLRNSLEAGGGLADFEESMALLSREFGFDPDEQLLPLLDGEWTLALLPAEEGLVAELTGQPLGLVLLASGDDGGGLSAAVTQLNQGLEGERLPLETVEIGGATATFVDLESLIGAPLPIYGVDDDVLFLGTDAQNLAEVLGGEGALGEEAGYLAAVALLPDGYAVSGYVDVDRLRVLLGDGSPEASLRLLGPVRRIIAGSEPVSGEVRHGVLTIVIDQAQEGLD